MEASDARTLLAKFGLVADHVLRTPATLSPGERTRASLAVLMARQTNLLVLDEPTNHLDLPAIEQLEVALEAFGGTVVLVTHDRSLLERVTLTRRIELANGKVVSDEPVAAARLSSAQKRSSPRTRCGSGKSRNSAAWKFVTSEFTPWWSRSIGSARDETSWNASSSWAMSRVSMSTLNSVPDSESELAAEQPPGLDPALLLERTEVGVERGDEVGVADTAAQVDGDLVDVHVGDRTAAPSASSEGLSLLDRQPDELSGAGVEHPVVAAPDDRPGEQREHPERRAARAERRLQPDVAAVSARHDVETCRARDVAGDPRRDERGGHDLVEVDREPQAVWQRWAHGALPHVAGDETVGLEVAQPRPPPRVVGRLGDRRPQRVWRHLEAVRTVAVETHVPQCRRRARLADRSDTDRRLVVGCRVYKTRSVATDACKAGHVQVNGRPAKASTPVRVGDSVEAWAGERDGCSRWSG